MAEPLVLDLPLVTARVLTQEDSRCLQNLYERCADYYYLLEGGAPKPTEAQDDLAALPPGKELKDKHIYGFFEKNDRMVGMLDCIADYPNKGVWWIGLTMLAPSARKQGLFIPLRSAVMEWLRKNNAQKVGASVIAENTRALRLWKGLGFEVVRVTDAQKVGSLHHVLYVIEKELTKA